MKNNEASLDTVKYERDRFVAFAFASADILMELDGAANIVFVDGATHSLLGKEPATLTNTNFLDLVQSSDKEFIEKVLTQKIPLGRFDNIKIHLKNTKGDDISFSVSGYTIPYLGNHFFLTLSHLRATLAADELATRDGKTGLLNRESFTWQVLNLTKNVTNSQSEMHMTVLDINSLIEALKKKGDCDIDVIVDEICDYIKSCSIDGQTAGLVEENRIGLIHSALIKSEDIKNSIVLYAESENTGEDSASLVKVDTTKIDIPSLTDADAAKAVLYSLNNFSKNKFDKLSMKTLNDSYRLMLGDTLNKIGEFKRVCGERDFDVALQPIMKLDSETPNHYEALLRLKNDIFRNSYHFITFAEQSGIVPEFDIAMCNKSLEIARNLSREGLDVPGISLNISGISVASELFRDALRSTLARNSDMTSGLIFEITESARIDDLKDTNEFIQELRATGIKCCIDDFGSGESTFDYIRNIEVDYVKIDGSYVTDCLKSERGKHLLETMIKVCQDMGSGVIAEMVESKDVSDFLKQLGVEMGQGFYFGEPDTDYKKVLKNVSESANNGEYKLKPKQVAASKPASWWSSSVKN